MSVATDNKKKLLEIVEVMTEEQILFTLTLLQRFDGIVNSSLKT